MPALIAVIREVIEQRSWSPAFLHNGFGAGQQLMSRRVWERLEDWGSFSVGKNTSSAKSSGDGSVLVRHRIHYDTKTENVRGDTSLIGLASENEVKKLEKSLPEKEIQVEKAPRTNRPGSIEEKAVFTRES